MSNIEVSNDLEFTEGYQCSESGLIWQSHQFREQEIYYHSLTDELRNHNVWRVVGPKHSVVDYLADRKLIYAVELTKEECNSIQEFILESEWLNDWKKYHPQPTMLQYWWKSKDDTNEVTLEYSFIESQLDKRVCKMIRRSENDFEIIESSLTNII